MTISLKERAPLLLCALFVIVMLPFLDKAAHIDDPLFLWTAEHILHHPLDFYGYAVNWYGWQMPMFKVMMNPPLTSYYLALLMAIGGGSEVFLHLGMLVPGVVLILGIYRLSELFCDRPWLATLLSIFTPALLIGVGGFMSESLLLPLWVWAVYCHVRGERHGDSRLLFMAACLVAASVLVKYNGMALVPLLLAYSVVRHRRPRLHMALMLLPVAVLAAYDWGTSLMYGSGILSGAMRYSLNTNNLSTPLVTKHLLTGLAFLGASLPGCILLLPVAWGRKALGLFLTILAAYFIYLLAIGDFCGVALYGPHTPGWSFALQAALFVTSGVYILVLTCRDALGRRDEDAIMLLLWVLGQFVFTMFLNWTISTRNVLPLVPAVAILAVRALERERGMEAQLRSDNKQPLRFRLHLPAAILLSAALAFSVALSDYLWANAGRTITRQLQQERTNLPDNIWFAGHWGFQFYMQRLGFKPLDHTSSDIKQGDLLVLPRKMLQRPIPLRFFEKKLELSVPGCAFLSVHHEHLLAGFHSSVYGPLPYVFAPSEPHRFEFHIAKRNIQLRQKK